MSYVTQGTIRLELKTASDATYFVSPTTDYAVRHCGKLYIVFIDTQSNPPESRLFECAHSFESKEAHFVELLREAALRETRLEFSMDSGCRKIESVTVPAFS
jgi:hypothetical protein